MLAWPNYPLGGLCSTGLAGQHAWGWADACQFVHDQSEASLDCSFNFVGREGGSLRRLDRTQVPVSQQGVSTHVWPLPHTINRCCSDWCRLRKISKAKHALHKSQSLHVRSQVHQLP